MKLPCHLIAVGLSDPVWLVVTVAAGGIVISWMAIQLEQARRRRVAAERRRGEEALRAKQAEFDLVTNAVPSLISHVDAEQRYVFVNDAFTKWFGVPRESILGRTVRDFVGERAWEGIGPKVARAYAGEKVEFEAEVPYQYGGRDGFTRTSRRAGMRAGVSQAWLH
jgi:PAS domain S-box-containing protein